MAKKTHAQKQSGVRPLQGRVTAKAQGAQAQPPGTAAQAKPRPVRSAQQDSRSLDQKRAAFALACVNAVKGEACKSEYRSYVRRLPAAIITNGLGQAIAMELAGSSKKDEVGAAHTLLLKHVSDWLETEWSTSPYRPAANSSGAVRLINAIIRKPQADLVRAQSEAMAFLKWLKKFAEALIPAKDDAPKAAETAEEG